MPTSDDIRKTAEGLLMMAPVDWPKVVEAWQTNGPGFDRFPPPNRRPTMDETVQQLDAFIEKAARLREYLEQRYGYGCGDQGHTDAVKASNRLAAKIRRALGYTYPRQDIHF